MMLPSIERRVFTVSFNDPGWVVEQSGAEPSRFKTQNEAMAFATRSANASQNAGFPAKILFCPR